MHHGDRNLVGEKALMVSAMAGGQKVTASQITNDLGYERTWNLGGKERGRQGGSVLSLTCTGMHYGDRNLAREKTLVVSSIAGGQKVTASQIADDLEYERT